MVLKKSKYGLNTGNTLRYGHKRLLKDIHVPALTKLVKNGTLEAAETELGDKSIETHLTVNVDYSLNKQYRWELIEAVKEGKFKAFTWGKRSQEENAVLAKVHVYHKIAINFNQLEIVTEPKKCSYFTGFWDVFCGTERTAQRAKSLEDICCSGSIPAYYHLPPRQFRKKAIKTHRRVTCKQCKLDYCLTCDIIDPAKCPTHEKYSQIHDTLTVEYCLTEACHRLSENFLTKFTKENKNKAFKKQKGNQSKGHLRDFLNLIQEETSVRSNRTSEPLQLLYDFKVEESGTMKKKLAKGKSMRGVSVESSKLNIPFPDELHDWLAQGEVDKLEQLVLDGHADMLVDQKSPHVRVRTFLKSLPAYKAAVEGYLTAVVTGNLQRVKEFVGYRHVVRARHPTTAATALHLCAMWGHLNVIRFLIRRIGTIYINEQDAENRTPLHYAAVQAKAEEDTAIYDLLKAHGANETLVDAEGYTPIHYTKDHNLLDLGKIRDNNKYPLAVRDNVDQWINNQDMEKLQEIILQGESWRLENRNFPSGTEHIATQLDTLKRRVAAIHESVWEGDEQAFKQLVDKRQLATAQDSSGATPLHVAVLANQKPIAEYIVIIHSHCIDEQDKALRTPLHYAACLGAVGEPYYQLLLSAGANKNIKDELENLPEYYLEHPEFAQEILSTVARTVRQRRKSQFARMESVAKKPPSASAALEELQIVQGLQEGILDPLNDLMQAGKTKQVHRWAKKYPEVAAYLKSYQETQEKVALIHMAIRGGHLRKVKNLIDRKKLIETRNHAGQTALHAAVHSQDHAIVEYLTKSNPKALNIPDMEGRLPVHYAAVQDNAIYEMLVEMGADVEKKDKADYTAAQYRENPENFTIAANHDQDDSVKSDKSTSGIDDNDEEQDDEWEEFAEDTASDAPNDVQIMQWLEEGDVENLERCVLEGRSDLLRNKTVENPVSQEFLEALQQYQSKIDAIHKAVEDGDVRRVKSLIDRSQLATARDRKGLTPLHKAVLHGQTDTLRYLLVKFPQTVNGIDHEGRTALHYAAADRNGGHYVKLLQKAGADAFIEDKQGHTPFYYRSNPEHLNLKLFKDAAVIDQLMAGELSRPLLQDLEDDILDWLHMGNIGKLEELVLNGYGDLLLGRTHEVEDRDVLNFLEILPQYEAKIRAIHRAVETGNLREVKSLTDRKKLALCRDSKGATPLHNSVLHGHSELVSYLLRNYPQAVNAQDHNKRTPLHYAAALDDAGRLYKMLRKAGGDPHIPDCENVTPKYFLQHPNELDLEAMRLDSRAALRQALQQRIAPSYLESSIQQWVREGNLGKLEQLVLSGCGDLLLDRAATNAETDEFINSLGDYLEKIDDIHRYVREGDMEALKHMIDQKKYAVARDRKGATPLHDSVLYGQTEVLRYLAQTYPLALNSPDYNKRTALHYAAAARDGGHYYKILEKAGADPTAIDNEGHTPEYYLRNPGALDLKSITEKDKDVIGEAEIFQDSGGRRSYMDLDTHSETPSEAPTPQSCIGGTVTDQMDLEALMNDGMTEEKSEEAFSRAFNDCLQMTEDVSLDDRRPLPTTENGLYLARSVGPVLTKALAEVVINRPQDPIAYLSTWLYKYHEEQLRRSNASFSGVGGMQSSSGPNMSAESALTSLTNGTSEK